MKDEIQSLVATTKQLLEQKDVAAAEQGIRDFVQKQQDEIDRLKAKDVSLRRQLLESLESLNSYSRYDEDYVPYPEEDYRD